jgi:putative addiction module component (TIGR02574 family)
VLHPLVDRRPHRQRSSWYAAHALTTATQIILDAAMKLPDDERAELAAILLDSIGDGRSVEEIDVAWLAEAKRRLEAVRSGRATVIPTEEVERELEDMLLDAPESRRAG